LTGVVAVFGVAALFTVFVVVPVVPLVVLVLLVVPPEVLPLWCPNGDAWAGAAANRAHAPAAAIPPPTATRAMVLKFA
jgi:hypothetical protein